MNPWISSSPLKGTGISKNKNQALFISILSKYINKWNNPSRKLRISQKQTIFFTFEERFYIICNPRCWWSYFYNGALSSFRCSLFPWHFFDFTTTSCFLRWQIFQNWLSYQWLAENCSVNFVIVKTWVKIYFLKWAEIISINRRMPLIF